MAGSAGKRIDIRPDHPMKIIPNGEPMTIAFRRYKGRLQMVMTGVDRVTRKPDEPENSSKLLTLPPESG